LRNRVIAFDLDDVLCYRTSDMGGKVDKYRNCKPIHEMIKIVNQCYEQGDKVIIYTARGMTGFAGNVHEIYSNLYELTKTQLVEWGIKHHQLIMGKAHYDLLIDDKVVNSKNIKNLGDIEKCL
jgi:hypothetical protein